MKAKYGFTLIELMVVVAIVAIIASVAVPSFQTQVRESRRAEGVAFAMDIASRQERYFTENSSYTSDLVDELGLPSTNSENGYFSASVTDVAGEEGDDLTNYVITITTGPDGTADAECGDFIVNNIGQRTVSVSTADAAKCWR